MAVATSVDVEESSSVFIDFPRSKEILDRLRTIEASDELEPLFVVITERLASRTYEASAFVFILIELLYEFEDTSASDLGYLLPKVILALTGNSSLAVTAVDAFTEIKESFLPPEKQTKKRSAADTQPIPVPATGDSLRRQAPAVPPEDEERMTGLQVAQKRIADLGLMTRVSIEIAVRRPDREKVNRTLREIAQLRSALRTFEERLIQSEQEVLRAAGILDDLPQ